MATTRKPRKPAASSGAGARKPRGGTSTGAGTRKPRPKTKGDGLTTTPTQAGTRSPDYNKKAGDPGFLKQYSEEQIGLMGGRNRIEEVVAAKRNFNDYLVSLGQDPRFNMAGYKSAGSPGAPKTKKTAVSGMAAPWENYGTLPGSSVLGNVKKEEGEGKGGGKKGKGKKGKGGKGKKQTTRRRNEGRSRAGQAKPRGKK